MTVIDTQKRNAAIRAALKVAREEGNLEIGVSQLLWGRDIMRLTMFIDGADQALSESQLEVLATDLKI